MSTREEQHEYTVERSRHHPSDGNLLQISTDYRHIQVPFYRHVLILSISCVVLCFLLVRTLKLNIGSIVGLFLIIAALKSGYEPFNLLIESLVRYERTYIVAMGIVHGLTNLGGSLLTAVIHSMQYDNAQTRATTAVSYGTFALCQLITLGVSLGPSAIATSATALYIAVGVSLFLATELLIYSKMSTERYRTTFAAFLFLSSIFRLREAYLIEKHHRACARDEQPFTNDGRGRWTFSTSCFDRRLC